MSYQSYSTAPKCGTWPCSPTGDSTRSTSGAFGTFCESTSLLVSQSWNSSPLDSTVCHYDNQDQAVEAVWPIIWRFGSSLWRVLLTFRFMVRSGCGRGRSWRHASLHVACVTVTNTYSILQCWVGFKQSLNYSPNSAQDYTGLKVKRTSPLSRKRSEHNSKTYRTP